MKKLLGLIVVLCCAFGLCVSLAGCGVDKSGFTGNWSLDSGTDATLDADSIALMKSLGQQVILTLNDDETGSMDLYGNKLEASWKASSATEGEITMDGKTSKLAIADEQLTLTDPDGKYLTFVKYEGELPSAGAASAQSSAAAPSSAAAASDSNSSTTASDAAGDADGADAAEGTDDAGAEDGDAQDSEYGESEGENEDETA